MNHLELQALRHLLFFSVPEAARHIPPTTSHGKTVEERTWRRWEDGTLRVPENIAEAMLRLAAWRERAIDKVVEAVCDTDDAGEGFALVWYSTEDAWATLNDHELVMWRPHCAVAADAVALGARLVEFDPVKYAQWLGKRKDSEPLRGQWAAETAGA